MIPQRTQEMQYRNGYSRNIKWKQSAQGLLHDSITDYGFRAQGYEWLLF